MHDSFEETAKIQWWNTIPLTVLLCIIKLPHRGLPGRSVYFNYSPLMGIFEMPQETDLPTTHSPIRWRNFNDPFDRRSSSSAQNTLYCVFERNARMLANNSIGFRILWLHLRLALWGIIKSLWLTPANGCGTQTPKNHPMAPVCPIKCGIKSAQHLPKTKVIGRHCD